MLAYVQQQHRVYCCDIIVAGCCWYAQQASCAKQLRQQRAERPTVLRCGRDSSQAKHCHGLELRDANRQHLLCSVSKLRWLCITKASGISTLHHHSFSFLIAVSNFKVLLCTLLGAVPFKVRSVKLWLLLHHTCVVLIALVLVTVASIILLTAILLIECCMCHMIQV
jgi:hypothetical protein